MKLFYLIGVVTFFAFCLTSFAQKVDLPKLIDQTQTVARKTAYEAWIEYTSDYKQTRETKNNKQFISRFETLCSRKTCTGILVSKDGKDLSPKTIQKNREKAAKTMGKAEQLSDSIYYTNKENAFGYGIMVFTWFNPSLYLRTCQTKFIEKIIMESRPTIKISVSNCNLNDISKQINIKTFQFMPKTDGFIWIDEQDTAIVKMEVYARREFPNLSATNKPLVIIEASRIPAGLWFWKSIKVDALENRVIFPEYISNWQYEFYNYRRFNVEIDKAEVDKKPN